MEKPLGKFLGRKEAFMDLKVQANRCWCKGTQPVIAAVGDGKMKIGHIGQERFAPWAVMQLAGGISCVQKNCLFEQIVGVAAVLGERSVIDNGVHSIRAQ